MAAIFTVKLKSNLNSVLGLGTLKTTINLYGPFAKKKFGCGPTLHASVIRVLYIFPRNLLRVLLGAFTNSAWKNGSLSFPGTRHHFA